MRANFLANRSQVSSWELHQIARDFSISLDQVILVKSIFDNFDLNSNGFLQYEEFESVVHTLVEDLEGNIPKDDARSAAATVSDTVRETAEKFWEDVEKDGSGSVNFVQF